MRQLLLIGTGSSGPVQTPGTPRRARLRWTLFLAACLMALMFWPGGSYDQQALDKLHCVAVSVALQEHLFVRTQAGETVDPAMLADVEERQNRLTRYNRSLTTSNDLNATAFRPIMVKVAKARDAAVAVDPEAYLSDAWAELQACDDTLFSAEAA